MDSWISLEPYSKLATSIPWEIVAIIKLTLAGILGAIIGLEREYRGRGAGLRTHLLVALGAALVMIISTHFADVYDNPKVSQVVRVDPTRLAYGIMAGIGFLGAGAIIQSRRAIRGLTTGASLWCAAAVGLGCGFGLILLSSYATFMVLFALIILDRFEGVLPSQKLKHVSIILIGSPHDVVKDITERLNKNKIKVKSAEYKHVTSSERHEIDFTLKTTSKMTVWELREIIGPIEKLLSIEIK